MKENQEMSFNEIYNEYKNLIYRIIVDIIQDPYEAEDICQETFIKFSQYVGKIEDKGIKRWLIAVAQNKSIDYIRQKIRRKEEEMKPEEESLQAIYVENSEEEAYFQEKEDLGEITKILEELKKEKPHWYEVFLLVELSDVPRKVVAKEKGIGLSTVDKYLKKSKEWLQERIKPML